MKKKAKSWYRKYPPICHKCQKEVPIHESFLQHEDGTILCKPCFDILKKEGVIK